MAAAALETASPPRATGPSTSHLSYLPSLFTSSGATTGRPSGVVAARSPTAPHGKALGGGAVVVVAPGTAVVDAPGAVVTGAPVASVAGVGAVVALSLEAAGAVVTGAP